MSKTAISVAGKHPDDLEAALDFDITFEEWTRHQDKPSPLACIRSYQYAIYK